jgi:hypothetical protein
VANKTLSNTAFAVLQLAKTLLYKDYEFSLFNKSELFRQLRVNRISTCNTTCKNVTTLVFSNSLDMWKLAWESLWSKIDSLLNNKVDTTLISVWQDSAIVRFAITIYIRKE